MATLGAADYDLGIIAGDRPLNPVAAALFLPGPNDGKVTVASTMLDGMADPFVVHTSHTRLLRHRPAIDAAIAVLGDGSFRRPFAR